MSASPTIFLSDRSYCDILNETSQHPQTETGGVLLGEYRNGKWFVVESIDPGPKAILQHSYFEYDQAYVNHLCNKVRLRYSAPIRLLGLWHRHPGSFDRFSGTDDGTHRRYVQQCRGPIISGLINIDPEFRMTFYVVDAEPVSHQRTNYAVGDQHFPPDLLRTLHQGALVARVNGAVIPALRGSQEMQIVERKPTSSTLVAHIVTPIKDWFGSPAPPAEPNNSQGVPPHAPGAIAGDALEMLDEELEYLDSQRDFEYELEMVPRGVLLTMQRLHSVRGPNGGIKFLFTVEADQRIVKHERNSYPFRKGIVEQVIGNLLY
ncbi:MAG: Mov34/MPN/PAD-1 family protein [Vicinamibacterales bacterium]